MTTETTQTAPQVSVYTPAELSYLLAGRGTAGATQSRDALGLTELSEGDTAVLAGAQALVATGRATVLEGNVVIGDEAKVIGYLLGTSTDWTKVSIIAQDDATGQNTVAMAFISAGPGTGAAALRIMPLGNVEVALINSESTSTEAARALVLGYAGHFENVTVGIGRQLVTDSGVQSSELRVSRDAGSSTFSVVLQQHLQGRDELTLGDGVTVTHDEFIGLVDTILAV